MESIFPWGKLERTTPQPRSHSLLDHMTDVAAVLRRPVRQPIRATVLHWRGVQQLLKIMTNLVQLLDAMRQGQSFWNIYGAMVTPAAYKTDHTTEGD